MGSLSSCQGQVEQNFAKEPFQAVTLVHPAGLLGNSNTPGQGIIHGTSFLMPTKYKPIEIVDIVQAMSAQALEALKEMPETRPTILEGTSLFWWVDKAKSIMAGLEQRIRWQQSVQVMIISINSVFFNYVHTLTGSFHPFHKSHHSYTQLAINFPTYPRFISSTCSWSCQRSST